MVQIPPDAAPPAPPKPTRTDDCTSFLYTHTPVAPSISDYAPNQRQFTHGSQRRIELVSEPGVSQDIYLMRFCDKAEAKLKIQLYGFGSYGETSVNLSADQCRDLASRLLDAAHDIEVAQ